MYCNAPTVAYRKVGIDPNTNRHYKPWRFIPFESDEKFKRCFENVPCPSGNEALILPCGRCLLCTRAYRRMWTLRCLHELRFHDQSCFVTLTCSDDNINKVFPPRSGSTHPSLSHKPFQAFMKRLRRRLDYHLRSSVRFYMCGEYGDTTHRPHYHVILFGFKPSDLVPLPFHKGQFVSPLLSELWPFGFHTVANVEPNCVSYVAGYCDKKLDDNRLQWAIDDVASEYVCMSRAGGIGRRFVQEFESDVYPLNEDGTFARNFCYIHNTKVRVKVPQFYDKILCLQSPAVYDTLLAFREKVGASFKQEFDLNEWLNESHRKHAVAVARRRLREPGVIV